MTMTTFKEVPEVKTVDFYDLAAGDYFYHNHTYYMKLIREYDVMNDKYCYNAVNLENGALIFFHLLTRVKPYKKCEVILHE